MSIQSDLGVTNQIQWKTNLGQPDWQALTNLTATQNPYAFIDASAADAPSRFYRVATLQVAISPADSGMVLIPAGNFDMGDPTHHNTQAPLHTVYVSRFYIATNLVTYASWQQVYQWATNHGYNFDHPGSGKADDHPVQTVSWYDVVKWCNARSEMNGLAPCYYTDVSQATVYRGNRLNLSNDCVNWSANGYRLPTEAEWEKAARGGLNGHLFPWGDYITHSQANYCSISSYYYDVSPTRGFNPAFVDGVTPYTSPGAWFAPNAYGLHDMAGNVNAWCWDWYSGTYYTSSPAADPRGPEASPESSRVLRGGSWTEYAPAALCHARGWDLPGNGFSKYGFRCVSAAP